MKELMIKVGKYCITNNLLFRKSNKGFISNNISAVQILADSIEELIEPLGWRLLEMKPKYNKETNSMSPHQYYLGPVKSKECTDENDFVI